VRFLALAQNLQIREDYDEVSEKNAKLVKAKTSEKTGSPKALLNGTLASLTVVAGQL
jgi:hypothetical protein